MSDFQSYLTNPQYIGNYNGILNQNTAMGVVYVEDASDIGFWQIFIDKQYPKKYSIKLASKEGKKTENNTEQVSDKKSTGKRFLETLYEGLNPQVLVAVDADYDYITAHFDTSHPFNHNQYILHTFGFSRESALIERTHLQDFFKRCRHTVEHTVDIDEFLQAFSYLAYDGLVTFITALINQPYQEYIQSDFHRCFNITDATLVHTDLTLDITVLETIQNNLDNLFVQQDFSDIDIQHTHNSMAELGINRDNAYRFICGHTLENLVKKIHEQLLKGLTKKESITIRENFKGKEIKNRVEQLNNSFEERFSLDTFFTTFPINDTDDIHGLIVQRVDNLSVS